MTQTYKPITVKVLVEGQKGGGGSGNYGHRGRPGHLGGSVGGTGASGGALGASAGDIKIGKYNIMAADAMQLDTVINAEAQSAFEDAWANGTLESINNGTITDNIIVELHDGSLTPLVQHAIGKFSSEKARRNAHLEAVATIGEHAGNQATKLAKTKYRDMSKQAGRAKTDAAKMPVAPAKTTPANPEDAIMNAIHKFQGLD